MSTGSHGGLLCPICMTYYGKPHRLGAQMRVCDACSTPDVLLGEPRDIKKRRVASGAIYTENNELELLRRRAREEIRI